MVRGNKSIFSHGLIAATLLAVSFAARAEMTYTITSYPAGLADLPCDAFKKNPDGSFQLYRGGLVASETFHFAAVAGART